MFITVRDYPGCGDLQFGSDLGHPALLSKDLILTLDGNLRPVYDGKQVGVMTLQLNWPSAVVNQLREEARQKGLSLDAYVLQVISLRKVWNDSVDEAECRRLREEAGASIRERRIGNILGPDLTIRDLMEEGRRF